MDIDLQARGFTLTPALAAAARREARDLARLAGDRFLRLQVRLFDVNGRKGGIDKGCLVAARLGRLRRVAVATSIDNDLYRAIPAAFDKLRRAIVGASDRQLVRRRRGPPTSVPA